MKWYSDRGYELVVCGNGLQPVITVENAVKWYSLYVAHPDGTSTMLPYDDDAVTAFMDRGGGTAIYDHVFNPAYVDLLGKRMGLTVDELAFDILVGRWVQEYDDVCYDLDELDECSKRAPVGAMTNVPTRLLDDLVAFVEARVARAMLALGECLRTNNPGQAQGVLSLLGSFRMDLLHKIHRHLPSREGRSTTKETSEYGG